MKIRKIIRNLAALAFLFVVVAGNTIGMWSVCLHSTNPLVAIWLFLESILATCCFYKFIKELKDLYQEFDES